MRHMTKKPSSATDRGFTLFELIAVLSIMGIMSAIAVSNLKVMADPLGSATATVEHLLRLARSRAVASTEVTQVHPISSTQIGLASSDSCTGTMTNLPELTTTLPTGATLQDTTWYVCFNQRGLADANIAFNVRDSRGQVKTVHIALGGGTKVD